MLKNYIIIAFRNLWRNKMTTLINLTGMALGFGIFISLSDWVRHDLSFDRFHEDIEKIYTLNARIHSNGAEYTSEKAGGIYASLLSENFHEIEAACRVSEALEFELGVRGDTSLEEATVKYFSEAEVLAADSNFFSFFSFTMVEGDPSLLLSSKDNIVLSKSMADKLFGDDKALYQDVKFGEGGYFTVVGVVEDPPNNSTLQFNVVMNFGILEELGYPIDGYHGAIYYNFFKVKEGSDFEKINRTVNELVEMNSDSDLDVYYFLEPYTRMYLFGETKAVMGVYVNLILCVLILLIACINFINLETAYFHTRIKEISVRKSIGAGRKQLLFQFLSETYIILLMAFYLGFFVAELIVPTINRSFGVDFGDMERGLSSWLFFLALYLLTGLVAGLYPALKITGFNPLRFLSGRDVSNSLGGKRSRKVLIVLQFSFSIFIAIASIFIMRQYTHLKEADLGFNREEVLYIQTNGVLWSEFELFKEKLEEMHFVDQVCTASEMPVMITHGEINWGDEEGEHNKFSRILWANHDFLSTFDIEMSRGEFFREEYGENNHQKVVVNEALLELMHWDDPIGRVFHLWDRQLEIIGVTKDFNFFPFKLEVFDGQALIYIYDEVREYIFVKIPGELKTKQISQIKSVFEEVNPGYEFNYDLVSEYEYDMLQGSEGIKILLLVFTVIAIFIAIMGLVGLSLYNIGKRTKEVGIRKAMGAASRSILGSLVSEFLVLVVISNAIAIPASILVLDKTFTIFYYRVELAPIVFVLVFLLSVAVTMLTVMYHALRIARANPVKSLRYE